MVVSRFSGLSLRFAPTGVKHRGGFVSSLRRTRWGAQDIELAYFGVTKAVAAGNPR
jgi:hypothetical protein